jgi:hypothetical protein
MVYYGWLLLPTLDIEKGPTQSGQHANQGPHCLVGGLQRAFIITAKRTPFSRAKTSRAVVTRFTISRQSCRPPCLHSPAVAESDHDSNRWVLGLLPPAEICFVSVAAGLLSYGRSHRFPSPGTPRDSGQPAAETSLDSLQWSEMWPQLKRYLRRGCAHSFRL